MIYHGLDDEHINFALDPIKHKSVLGVSSSPFLRAIDFCRNLLFQNKTDVEEFEEFLFDILVQAEQQICSLLKNPPNQQYDGDDARFLSKLKDYLRIIVAVSNEDASNQTYKHAILKYIDDQIVVSFSYQVDRLSERYKIKREHFLLVDSSVVVSAMILSEIYAFIKAGYLCVQKLKGGFQLELNDAAHHYREAHGISELLEDKSNKSDCFNLYQATSWMNLRYTPPELASHLIDEVFDKVLSIKPRYISDEVKSSKHYRFMRECVAILTFAECFKLRGFDVPATFFIENKLCRSDSMSIIINNLRELNTLEGKHFSALTFDGKSFKSGNLEFKLATRHVAYNSSKLLTRDADVKKDLIKFGDIFEKDYIFRYVQSLDPARYHVYPSISPNNNAQVKGYDIDLVIEDKSFNQFYFVQVKYRTKWLPKFYSERYWELNTGILKDYERQLRIFKDNFNHPSIRQKLNHQKYKGLERATKENSHFVFLHNLPFLNFYEFDGIYFYEWNLFRNLMQGAKTYWKQGATNGVENRKSFMLHDTVAAIAAYSGNDEEKTSIGPDLGAYINSVMQLKVKHRGTTTHVDMPLI
ncbi:hypothetical protein ACI7YQ_14145 [Alteromonas marina]|nr:hypothetical protein KUL113_12520 [Tenacibaculum sp. KUL113]